MIKLLEYHLIHANYTTVFWSRIICSMIAYEVPLEEATD